MSIPIVIGVTGHRDLREQDLSILRKLVHDELEKLMNRYPHSPLIMLNSLAQGADLLCAEIASELGIELKCPLPMAIDEYRRDFSGDDIGRFELMLTKAKVVFVAPWTERAQDTVNRDFHYRQAGIYIATHSHVLLALWDGSPAKPDGCGTAETVEFMNKGKYENSPGGFRAANDGAVIQILSPRQNENKELAINVKLIENEAGSLYEILSMTEAFNSDAEESQQCENCKPLLPDEYSQICTGSLKGLHDIYRMSNGLALQFEAKYLNAIKWFSIFGMLLVFSFLLYDELESNIFLLGYGLLITVYVLNFFRVRKSQWHMKYLQYRVLSETLRTQFYLTAVGMDENISDAFTWTQRQDSTWIRKAVSALMIGTVDKYNVKDSIIKTSWIDGQLTYHQKAQKRDLSMHLIKEKTSKYMLICSISLFLLVLLLELASSDNMTRQVFAAPLPAFFLPYGNQALVIRSLLKIMLGGISAVTVLLSNYYGRLSFERKKY